MKILAVPLLIGLVTTLWAGPSGGRLNYKRWQMETSKPVAMKPNIAALCQAPIPSTPTDHGQRFYRVFTNASAHRGMTSKTRYKVGSTIVKEKLIPSAKEYRVELLTVMTKHRKGFDSANHDWEFYVTDSDGKRISPPGSLKNCAGCHGQPGLKDMVFGKYATGR